MSDVVLKAKETGVGVLDKAMAILLVFPRGDLALTPQEIAERTGLPLPTVYRLAQALYEHGLLTKDGSRFRLGMTLLHLGMLVARDIDVRQQALSHLRWLNEQTGENAELHMRQDETRLVIEVVNSPHNLRPSADIGMLRPLHRGAAGKVLLAWLPQEQRDALSKASVARFGDADTFNRQQFFDELDRVKAQGWASSDGERFAGVSAIAAPIFAANGLVAGALTLVAPSARLSRTQQEHYLPLVSEAARRASYDLGYVISASANTPT
jgi:DNA-binding IclR family transcriptional regulator